MAAVLDHLWQSTLFAALAGAFTLLFRDNRAGVRSWVWFAASAKFLLPFSVLVAAGSRVAAQFGLARVNAGMADELTLAIAPFSAASPWFAQITFWFAALWALGALVIALRWFARWRRLNAIVRVAKPLAIAAPMPVRATTTRMEPGLVGVFRPILLLPEHIEASLSPTEMKAMLAHEICHMRRRDNLTASIHMLVETVFWFHPLVWWIGARMIEERERACDEAVIASGNDPKVYAQGLLNVCKLYLQTPLPCAAGISGADLKKRVEDIMTSKAPTALTAAKKAALAVAAVIALAAPLALGAASAPAFAQGAPLSKPVWLEKPNGLSFEKFYPAAAVAQKTDGKVLLGCTVLRDGRLTCAVKSEAPTGLGFGDAALGMYPEFRMAPKDGEGKSTAGRAVNVPIMFKISE